MTHAERDDHRHDGDDNDTNVDADTAWIDRGEHLSSSDGVDSTEANERDQIEESRQDGAKIAVRVPSYGHLAHACKWGPEGCLS